MSGLREIVAFEKHRRLQFFGKRIHEAIAVVQRSFRAASFAETLERVEGKMCVLNGDWNYFAGERSEDAVKPFCSASFGRAFTDDGRFQPCGRRYYPSLVRIGAVRKVIRVGLALEDCDADR